MVKEADEVGDFLHAQKISDELASAEEAFRKRLPLSQNLAKQARKKAARLEREIEARANGTWITPAQERLSRRKANEKRAEADPKWAALKESKKAESKATLKAVRRYAMLREQREHSAYQDEQPSRRAYDQGKQDVPASTFSEQQLGQRSLHQQHSILQSVHPPSREADAEVRSKKRKLESQAEAASRKVCNLPGTGTDPANICSTVAALQQLGQLHMPWDFGWSAWTWTISLRSGPLATTRPTADWKTKATIFHSL